MEIISEEREREHKITTCSPLLKWLTTGRRILFQDHRLMRDPVDRQKNISEAAGGRGTS